MTLLHWARRGLTALGAAALAGSAGAAAAPAAARPALWEVSDRDTRIYLFGTIHLLPADYRWRTAKFDAALAKSDTLVVETEIDKAHPQALASDLARLGFGNGLPPLLDRVPRAKRDALAKAIAKTGIPLALFNRMETWAAAFSLIGLQFNDLGLKGEHGVEEVLRTSFQAAGKPIGQLETNAEQLGFFDRLSEGAQRALLEGAIDDPAATRSEFDAMLKSWARGDVNGIARNFNAEFASSPELLDTLLKRRNANWARWIAARMAQPGTVMVAVGAGHLAGGSSVQAMLQRGGYKVRRVQ